MRRIELLLLSAVLAIGCAEGPVTDADGGTSDEDGGHQADAGHDGGGETCVDEDGDGYGEGCALGAECDDADPAVSPAATEMCNAVDDDCDGSTDEELSAPSCEQTQGVCAGAVARCDGAGGFLVCDATDYGASYEADETLCDGMDNDCDGSTDEGCTCTDGETQACGSDTGECAMGTQTCTGGTWGACDDVAPMGEVCDGLDNDCDGMTDEPADLTAPTCALQIGVCAGSVSVCGGASGWACDAASYGSDYEETETSCDGLDNDCDGVTDDGCECVDGATQPCGTDVGVCMAGTQTCTSGAWGSCAGEVTSTTEICDGLDQDCNGTADDGVTAPLCALQDGVCAGTRQRCTGTGGFVACNSTDYGPDYESTESSCDGRDNDCDALVDEGCDCVDGATQDCGLSAGVCERGMQTCTAGEWSACTGGVESMPELCNGLDDDCNGSSDDGLTPMPCPLQQGVCAGAVQTCGGTSGWACDATAYGPLYVMTEDGATDEGVCDGLDNDCNGTVDDGCTSGPVVAGAEDEAQPDLYNQHLVYLTHADGNWDVAFHNFATGETRRLTTTALDEAAPKVYGNHVVYLRNPTGDPVRYNEVVVYDLTTDIETVISTRPAASVDISRDFVVFDALEATSWEIYAYSLVDSMTYMVLSAPTAANELFPSIRGGRVAYVSDESGTYLTTIADLNADPATYTTQAPATMSANGQTSPIMDYDVIGWGDLRNVTTSTGSPADDWDIYGAPFDGAYGTEVLVAGAGNAQYLDDIDGQIFVWTDYSSGTADPAVGGLGGGGGLLSILPAAQGNATISGDVILWQDNRLGGFDLYRQVLPGPGTPPEAGWIVINEILADPGSGADVNGDGTASTTQDEFVELVNATGIALDISGMTLSDASSSGLRHTFPAGTVIPAFGTIVVFGGGASLIGTTALFGGAMVQPASTGSLGLNNGGDTITLELGGTPIDSVTYGSGVSDESLIPDGTGTWVAHSTVTGSSTWSPGTSPLGFGY